jgi:hypothetical protein
MAREGHGKAIKFQQRFIDRVLPELVEGRAKVTGIECMKHGENVP